MSIEFRCSQCSQLLRVPESAAGKNARCPKCQALMTVPAVATAMPAQGVSTTPDAPPIPPPLAPPLAPPSLQLGADASPGPPQPQPAGNPFASDPAGPSFAAPTQPAAGSPFATSQPIPDSLNPYASPTPTAYAYAPQYWGGPRPGLPWENEQRTLGCWFRTMGLVIGSPTRAFSIMRQYGGLGVPLLYNLYAVGMLMALVAMIFIPIGLLVAFAAGQDVKRGDFLAGAAFATGFGVAFALFYGVILTVVMPLIWSAITHLMLLMYGAARQGFETTFRVICFGYFSVLLPGMFLAIVPYIGGLAMSVWMIVVIILGISRAHEISGGKATLAVLTPALACCGLYVLLIVAFLGASFSGAFKG